MKAIPTLPAIAVAAACALVVFAAIPEWGRLAHEIHKLGHPVAFALVAVSVAVWLDGRAGVDVSTRGPLVRRAALAFVVAVALGAATELLQILTNRGSSVVDVGRDAVGAAAGVLGWIAWRRRGRTRYLAAALSLVVAIGATVPLLIAASAWTARARSFPVLFQCDRPFAAYFVDLPSGAECRAEAGVPTLAFSGTGSGVGLVEPVADWRGFDVLAVDVTNRGRSAATVAVRVHDRTHDWRVEDRYDGRWVAAAGAVLNLRIPLADVARAPAGRTLDLEHVAGVAIFAADGGFATLAVGPVRLERRVSPSAPALRPDPSSRGQATTP